MKKENGSFENGVLIKSEDIEKIFDIKKIFCKSAGIDEDNLVSFIKENGVSLEDLEDNPRLTFEMVYSDYDTFDYFRDEVLIPSNNFTYDLIGEKFVDADFFIKMNDKVIDKYTKDKERIFKTLFITEFGEYLLKDIDTTIPNFKLFDDLGFEIEPLDSYTVLDSVN